MAVNDLRAGDRSNRLVLIISGNGPSTSLLSLVSVCNSLSITETRKI